MDNKRDVDKNDMLPAQAEPAAPAPLEQSQKDAARERLEEGGYQ